MGAEGELAVGLAQVQAIAGLEPLPVAVDERDQRDGDAEEVGGQIGQAVEGGFRGVSRMA